jgi:hypothetical protein
MLKKTVLLLILAAIVTGGVFAEDSFWNTSFKFDSGPTAFKGALFVDLGYTLSYLWRSDPGFGIGVGWEGRISDSSTYLIGGNIGIYGRDYWDNWRGYKYTAFDFGIEGNYRYYFFKSAIDKLFINGGLGFGITTWTQTYRYGNTYDYAWAVLYIPIYAGYKVIMGPGFTVELQTGYRVGIGFDPDDYDDRYVTKPDFGGFLFGIAIGWAFK